MIAPPGINLIFHSVRPGGGMERYVLDLIAALSRRGIPLKILTRCLEWPGQQPPGVEFKVLQDRTPFSRLNNLQFEASAIDHIRQGWPTIAISRVPNPTDLAIAGGTHRGHLKDKGRKFQGFFDRFVIRNEQALYDHARRIVAHSERVRQEIIRYYGIDPDKIATYYPPIDTSRFSLSARQGRDTLRQEIGVKPDELLLLFPSNNHVLKGADLILAALDGFDPRMKLVVAGKAPLKHPDAINLGFRQDMSSLYGAADAVILASKYEAFGLVGPEAILCGTAVLFAHTVGAVEVLSTEACLRFERTVSSLRSALSAALARFDTGTLTISEPSQHILYPYSIDVHLDALMVQLQP